MSKQILFLILISGLVLSACGSSGSPGSSSNPDENATLPPVPTEYARLTNPLGPEGAGLGAEVFRTNCEPCHGSQGHGDGPAGQALDPHPRNLAELQARAGDDFLFWRIRDGKPGTPMVGWKGILTDEQIWQVISFLHTLK